MDFDFRELVLLGVLGSASVAYYLFTYTTYLGPYGTPGDVYHEIILAGLLFMAFIFVVIASELKDDQQGD
jgi:hypothetical protein